MRRVGFRRIWEVRGPCECREPRWLRCHGDHRVLLPYFLPFPICAHTPQSYLARAASCLSTQMQHDEERIPDLVATIEGGGYANIQPPERLDVRSDPSTWPRPGAPSAGGSTNLSSWDAVVCINMVHIAPPVR